MAQSSLGTWTAVLALLLTPLAGCLGNADGGDQESLRRERADVSASLGGIEGTVTDDAVAPIADANITIVELGESVKTEEDGSFAFSLVRPGTYTVTVDNGGFVPAEATIAVSPNRVAVVDFIIAHLVSNAAYTQVFELVGFFECGFEVGWNVSSLPAPADYFFLGLAACAVPNFVSRELGGGNATNDRFLHLFRLDPPIDTLVYEMVWEPNGPNSQWMATNIEVAGFPNDGIGRFVLEEGQSPIQTRVEKDAWVQLDEEFRAACDEGTDAYCGFDFWEKGWPLQTRVFPAFQCVNEQGGACAAVQQQFTHYVSAFYNAPAPDGYSVLGGGST